jgi:hypothetical protein
MIEPMQFIKRRLILGILSAQVCFGTIGCLLESSFNLAADSRLPRWESLPAGLTRADVSLTVSYYTTLWGGSAQFILQNRNKQTIERKNGKVRCGGSFQLRNAPQGSPSGYPEYEAVTFNGITEIFEQRRPEDVLYITDDPAVWKQYHAIGCG